MSESSGFVQRVRTVSIRWCIYACAFVSGWTTLIFEVLWSRQFVTLFGNSSYAISIVLCAYMAGLGLGGIIGGRLADRIARPMLAYSAFQAGVAAFGLGIPLLLDWLEAIVPSLPGLSPESLLLSTLARFVLAFTILIVPCLLMGMTLPLLVREVTKSKETINTRIGAVYSWNTLGAAAGCLAAGFWMLQLLGLHMTNLIAAGDAFLTAVAALALSRPRIGSADVEEEPTETQSALTLVSSRLSGFLLLGVAFLNGLGSLMCEVLWIRYLAFLDYRVYVFPTILCVYLLGLGLGSLVYSAIAPRIHRSTQALGMLEVALGVSILVTFVSGALLFGSGPPQPLGLKGMVWITVFVPTILMGMAFPLLCGLYGQHVKGLGRRVGLLYAVNTAGTVLGSLLPLFVFVPTLGIQRCLLLSSLLYGGVGLWLLVSNGIQSRSLAVKTALVYGTVLLLFLTLVPPNLCQRVFLGTDFGLARHTDILFYREGRTGTAIVTRNRINNTKIIYINGVNEVPAGYAQLICFKMMGDLGPMLHPNPDDVLMICFGGGIASGAMTRMPDVKSLTIVDLESSVVEAARLFGSENNDLLLNPKTHVVIDDGRNYVMTAKRRWPVIISDSTHPKSGDSWVLYTDEFYRLVRHHLTPDGIFVQWLPFHQLSTAETKIILRTF